MTVAQVICGNTERATNVVLAASDDHGDEVEAELGHSMGLPEKGGMTEVPKRGGTTKLPQKGGPPNLPEAVHHQKGSTGVEVATAPQISCNRTNCN